MEVKMKEVVLQIPVMFRRIEADGSNLQN